MVGEDLSTDSSRRHLMLMLADDMAEDLQSLRTRWDPVMASRIPPHVSLVYPEESSNEALLLERSARAAAETPPFAIWLDAVEGDRQGSGGVWFPVIDPSDTWSRLRQAILAPPFEASQVTPHATVVHPRTSHRSPEALDVLHGRTIGGECRLDEILFTETTSSGMEILNRFPLSASPPVRIVAGLLRTNGKVLMCHRRPNRASFPDVWDLPGGHIEEGETTTDALVRELNEEIGISVEPPTGPPFKIFRAEALELCVFLIDHWEGEPHNLAVEEHDDLRWVHHDDLDALDLADEAYQEMVREALE